MEQSGYSERTVDLYFERVKSMLGPLQQGDEHLWTYLRSLRPSTRVQAVTAWGSFIAHASTRGVTLPAVPVEVRTAPTPPKDSLAAPLPPPPPPSPLVLIGGWRPPESLEQVLDMLLSCIAWIRQQVDAQRREARLRKLAELESSILAGDINEWPARLEAARRRVEEKKRVGVRNETDEALLCFAMFEVQVLENALVDHQEPRLEGP